MVNCCRICESEDATDDITHYQESFEKLTQIEMSLDPVLPCKICQSCIIQLEDALNFREFCLINEQRIGKKYGKKQKFKVPPVKVEVTQESEKDDDDEEDDADEADDTKDVTKASLDLQFIRAVVRRNKENSLHGYIELCAEKNTDEAIENELDAEEDDSPRINLSFLDKTCAPEYPAAPDCNFGPPYECKECNVSYTKISSYKAHWHFKHKHKNRKLICQLCGKHYPKKSMFEVHMMSHKPKEELPYACDICGSRFARKLQVVNHMMVHTKERPVVCSYCGKSFMYNIDLKRHMTIHTGIYLYYCRFCDKGFNRKKQLEGHHALFH